MSDSINASVMGFTALVEQQAAAAQVAANALPTAPVLNFTSGSVIRSLFEAVAGVALWLQTLVLNLLLTARAATSAGTDLDTWMADFGVTRIAGSTALCATVQLGRYSNGQAVTYAPGGLVMTSDGSQQYKIITDTTQAAWSTGASGYVAAAGVSQVQVTVQAVNAGSAANVAAGTITQFASGIVGADTVTNSGPAAGGTDAETDGALRSRFRNYLIYLWKATIPAIIYAAQSVQAGLTAQVTENQDEAGNYKPGYFFVTIDDGSGNPPGALLDAVAGQVSVTRGASINWAVHGPSRVPVNVVATIGIADGYTGSAVQISVQSAVTAFINASVLAQNLGYFQTGGAIVAVPGVAELTSLTLNGGAADITALSTQKIIAGTVEVSIA